MRAGILALRIGIGLMALAAGGGAAHAAARNPVVHLSASERLIRITPWYRGELVHVEGTVPAPCGVILKLTSPREDVICSRRGKKGPFWLSVGQVRFKNVPRMFKIKATEPVEDLLPLSEQVKYHLGRAGLKVSMGVDGDLDRDLFLEELILIRERARLFSFQEGQVERVGDTFRTSFFWPPDGPPGHYRVEAYAVDGRRVVGSAVVWVEVRAVGLESWIGQLAQQHGVLYGLLAVGVAVVAGVAVFLLFSRASRPGKR